MRYKSRRKTNWFDRGDKVKVKYWDGICGLYTVVDFVGHKTGDVICRHDFSPTIAIVHNSDLMLRVQ